MEKLFLGRVSQFNFYVRIFVLNMFGGLFREIDRAVLAARTAEVDHQVVEVAFEVVVHRHIHDGKHVAFELVNGGILVEVVDDAGVFAGEGTVLLFASRVGQCAAVEYKSPTVR